MKFLEGFNPPVVAQVYYRIQTGEELESEVARKRFWAQVKYNKVDDKILLRALKLLFDNQRKNITAARKAKIVKSANATI